jgi:riboflavin synthase
MFTGIIQERGTVSAVQRTGGGSRIEVRAKQTASNTMINDSVCINGACQTVIARSGDSFIVEAVEETLKKTTLGTFKPMQMVNLELPLRLSDRVGGHLVQGHVDGVGKVTGIEKQASSWLVRIELPVEFMRYVIPVGSIAIDGVSLTVARLDENGVTVSLIPHTLEVTTLSALEVGQRVNVELDLLGKYIERLIARKDDQKDGPGLSREVLKEWGYEI